MILCVKADDGVETIPERFVKICFKKNAFKFKMTH